jgi:hypothetical protein
MLVLAVHRLGPILGNPFWLDEAWVALSTKMPIGNLPWATSSTPLGWTFLISLLPAHGQVLRLVPWLFLAGSVFGGYLFGRRLDWPDRAWAVLGGLAGAGGALLLPAQALRHDLKQYTADAAIAVLLMVLLAGVEAAGSRRRLTVLGAAVVVGMLFSHTTALVGVAVLAAVAVLHRREWRVLAVFVPVVAAGMALVYVVVDGAARNGALNDYWAGYFPAIGQLPHYLGQRLGELRMYLGLPWPLYLLLAVAGIVTVARYGRPVTAGALALLPLLEIVLGVGRKYPLLDVRTSHFLLVTYAILAGIGIVGGLSMLASVLASVLPSRLAVAGTAVATLVAFGAFAVANRQVLVHPGPIGHDEDARAQVAYLAAHRKPGDTILVSFSGAFAFAYYWRADQPTFVRGGRLALGWHVEYPAQDRIVVAPGSTPDDVAAGFTAARRMAGDGRLWVVLSHARNNGEDVGWQAVLAGQPVTTLSVGPEPLLRLGGDPS